MPYKPQCWFTTNDELSATLFIDLTPSGYALASGFSDVYQTNVPGLGVRYTFNSSACGAANVILTGSSTRLTCPISTPNMSTYAYAPGTVTVTAIVTGAIKGGVSSASAGPVVQVNYVTSDAPKSWPQTNLTSGSVTGNITQATCSVTQGNVAVQLPGVGTGALSSSVGDIAGSQAFALSFSCAAGAKVLITLTDSVNPANRGNTLQLTADSTARGVGVQVLNGGVPVSFGPDSATVGNTNQWLIGASPDGPLQVPLTARYISTGTVAAGTIKALATFTMSYQ